MRRKLVYFSANVQSQLKKEICRQSNFKQIEELGCYLAAIISNNRSQIGKHKYVVERVKRRLNGWKASSLSLAGRITLIKSVTSSMVLYPMQHSRIPHGTIEEIEREQRKFLWGEQGGYKRWHAIAWNKLNQVKQDKGLNIKSLSIMNDSFILKLLWRFISNPNDLWVQVLQGKYGWRTQREEEIIVKPQDSKLWKEMVKLWETFRANVDIRQPDAQSESKVIRWKPSHTGALSTAATYNWIQGRKGNSSSRYWIAMWKLRIPK